MAPLGAKQAAGLRWLLQINGSVRRRKVVRSRSGRFVLFLRGGRQLAGMTNGSIAFQPASVAFATVGACPGKPPDVRLLILISFRGSLLLLLLGVEDVGPRLFEQETGYRQVVTTQARCGLEVVTVSVGLLQGDLEVGDFPVVALRAVAEDAG